MYQHVFVGLDSLLRISALAPSVIVGRRVLCLGGGLERAWKNG
jgi:hypothetical protein